jgi:hypothetical protein
VPFVFAKMPGPPTSGGGADIDVPSVLSTNTKPNAAAIPAPVIPSIESFAIFYPTALIDISKECYGLNSIV